MGSGHEVLAYDAIVLAGGQARRMGGINKLAARIDGIPILDRVLAGVAEAASVLVVGPEVQGGPVAAIASALPSVSAPVVVTLAGDQPWIGPAVHLLVGALEVSEADAAVLTRGGRTHYLAAAWRRSSLASALATLADPNGAAVRTLFDGADVVEVPDEGGWSRDIDSPEDLPLGT